jgi:predicted deacylase
MKPFAAGGPLIAKNCIDSFWCADCGRMLCSKHRSHQLHTCEQHNAELQSKRTLSKEQIAAELARSKAAAEAEAERQRIESVKAELQKKRDASVPTPYSIRYMQHTHGRFAFTFYI